MKPVILIDVDGVCVKWQSGLPYFMAKYNINADKALQTMLDEKFRSPEEIFGLDKTLSTALLKEYNQSKFIRYLSAYDDALEFINENKSKYDFVAITAIGTDTQTMLNRVSNLNALFPGAFIDVLVCGFNESKLELFERAKEKYADRAKMFIDDLYINIHDCEMVFPNLPTYLMKRGKREQFLPKFSKTVIIESLLEI